MALSLTPRNPVGSRFTTPRLWLILSAALLLPLLAGVVKSGGAGFVTLGTVLGVTLGVEGLKFLGKKNRKWDFSLVFQSLLLASLLPADLNPTVPLWASGLLLVFRFVSGKPSWINPVLAVWALLQFSWVPGQAADAVTGASPLVTVKTALASRAPGGAGPMEMAGMTPSLEDQGATDWLNNHIFGLLNVSLPGGYMDLLVGNHISGLGDASRLLILLVSVVLLGLGIVSWEIPFTYFLTHALLVWIFGALPYGGGLFSGNMLFYLLSGSFLFSLIFLSTDYETSPLARNGRLIYGLVAGVFVTVMRLGIFPQEGVGLGLILAGFTVPILDNISKKSVKVLSGVSAT